MSGLITTVRELAREYAGLMGWTLAEVLEEMVLGLALLAILTGLTTAAAVMAGAL